MSLSLPESQTTGCQCCGELGTVGLHRELWSSMKTDNHLMARLASNAARLTPHKIWEAQTTQHVRAARAGCACLLSEPRVFSRVAKLWAGTTNPFGTRLCCQGCINVRRRGAGRMGGWGLFHQTRLCLTPVCCGELHDVVLSYTQEEERKWCRKKDRKAAGRGKKIKWEQRITPPLFALPHQNNNGSFQTGIIGSHQSP